MLESTCLNNHFLIAMPQMLDPNFQQTVTYICDHDEHGALGIIVNRPLKLSFAELLEHLEVPPAKRPEVANDWIFAGGPVQSQQGFIVHSPLGQWEATLKVTEQIGLTTSADIIQALARDEGPEHTLMALGYAGWGPGQLEQEIVDHAWLCGPASQDILFSVPVAQRWSAAAAALGVDLRLLATTAGHA